MDTRFERQSSCFNIIFIAFLFFHLSFLFPWGTCSFSTNQLCMPYLLWTWYDSFHTYSQLYSLAFREMYSSRVTITLECCLWLSERCTFACHYKLRISSRIKTECCNGEEPFSSQFSLPSHLFRSATTHQPVLQMCSFVPTIEPSDKQI
jgi:hypothetical protein